VRGLDKFVPKAGSFRKNYWKNLDVNQMQQVKLLQNVEYKLLRFV
jgi:hypothetical protein